MMKNKDSYELWLAKKIKIEDNLYVLAIPVVGWVISIIMFSFVYPIWYLFRQKLCSKCGRKT